MIVTGNFYIPHGSVVLCSTRTTIADISTALPCATKDSIKEDHTNPMVPNLDNVFGRGFNLFSSNGSVARMTMLMLFRPLAN